MTDDAPDLTNLACPVPRTDPATIQMAHGGGGRRMHQLIEEVLLAEFAGVSRSGPAHDSAVLEWEGHRLAFTTDSFVVSPLFFPGGDIGKLAVCGTVNDLAMAGAVPRWLSCALILEEGLPMDTLRRVIASMQAAATEAGVAIVTGDTKVVDRGKGDGISINTAGVGTVPPGIDVSPARIRVGDRIVVSGDLGRHGIAIMSVREGLEFEGALSSDCASLADLVRALRALGSELHCLRDLTRGGLAAALSELAEQAQAGIRLDEAQIPIEPQVAGACELMGLDPLYVANEGRLVAFVAPSALDNALEILASHPAAPAPACIGQVVEGPAAVVELRNQWGSGRLLDLLSGEQMPRIC